VFCVNLRVVFFSDTHEKNYGEKMLVTRARFRAVAACFACIPDGLSEQDLEVFKEVIHAGEMGIGLSKDSENRTDAIRMTEVFASVPDNVTDFAKAIEAATHVSPPPASPVLTAKRFLIEYTDFLSSKGDA